ncbi:MAG: tandem-95 repeat protein [bacterium]|nr:tandem-95 repeat protein [bacterium]
MISVLPRKSAPFLFLGVFALLFGMVGEVSAEACKDVTGWKNADFPCTINYSDPTGGSNLTVCQYRVLSNGVQTVPAPPPDPGWSLASGTCSGSSATLSINISIGAGLGCKDNGENQCKVEFRAEDNAGNSGTGTIVTLDVDYDAPQTTITPNGSTWGSTSVAFSLTCTGETGESGCKTPTASDYKIVGSSTTCTALGLTAGTSGTVSCASGSACEQKVCYRSTDVAGNVQGIQPSNVFQIDKKKPEIVSFDVNPKKSAGLWVNVTSPNITIAWRVKEESPNSGLKEVQVWRSGNGGISWQQIPGSPFAAPVNDWTSSTTDSPADGTYLYGIHVKDNVENEITETEAGFSTIEVQVDKTAPTVTINKATGQADPAGSSPINFTVVFSESVTGFAGSDATITGTAGGTKTVVVTPGSGTTYNLAVNGMTSGTVIADIPANGATDAAGNENTASGTATVTYSPNAAPVATAQTVITNEDIAITITLGASDVETCNLTFSKTDPVNGTLGVITNNVCTSGTPNTDTATIVYTPDDNYSGSASFTFTVTDAASATSTATISISVAAVNDPPTLNAITDPAAINEDAGLQTVNLAGISAGGGESQALTVTATSATTSVIPNPAVTYTSPNATGSLSYTPVANASGSSMITVTVKDVGLDGTAGNADDGIATRTFTVNVTAVNDAPTASNGTLTTNEDTQGTGVLSASDIDGNPLTYSIVSNGSKGTAAITNIATGAYTYTPSANQNGSDSFTFRVNDGTVNSNTATISITINAVNDPPVAVGESYNMNEGTTLTQSAETGVLANDTDVEGSTLTAGVVSIPANGSLILNTNGSLVYTPIANFNGTDSFTYRANDGTVNSNAATVTITVTDGTAPTTGTFSVNGNSCSGNSCNSQVVVNSTFVIAWTASESGGSYLGNAKIYKAVFRSGSGNCHNTNKSGCSWEQVGSTIAAPASVNSWSSSATDNPVDETYWYGIHISDNAENCIKEDTGGTDKGHCGGVTLDGLDIRTDRGPIKVRMQHNQAPSISQVSDSPDPIKADAQITFTAQWNDPDNDSVSFFVCKNSTTPSGGDCSGGSANRWCRKPVPPDTTPISSGTNAACSYTTQALDQGTSPNAYHAFVCDSNGCSAAKQGDGFTVDATAPTIAFFGITPEVPNWANNAFPSITINWNVSDSGGAHLDRVEAYRAAFDSTDPDGDGQRCDNASKLDCVWVQAGSAVPLPDSDSWNCGTITCPDRIIDNPGSGAWWYGMHVVDKAGNCKREDGSACTAATGSTNLKRAWVDTVNPSTAVTSPVAGTWFRNDFNATFDDSDLGGSGFAASCQYEYIGLNPSGPNTTSGVLTRACDLDTKNIAVGAVDICRFEEQNRCRVRTKAFDRAGNTSGWQTASFGVDLTEPLVGIVSPLSVQAGVPVELSASLRDPIGKVTGCSFYSNPPDWAPHPASFTPVPCENNTECTVIATYTFAAAGDYQAGFRCQDQAGNLSVWNLTTVTAKTLSATLNAVPSSGSTNTKFDLSATVSGTMTGNANFKFDCDTSQMPTTWNFEIDNIGLSSSDVGWVSRNDKSGTSWQTMVNHYAYNAGPPVQEEYSTFAVQDLCKYATQNISPGYTAKVFVQRGVGSAEVTKSISVAQNSPPVAAITCEPASCTIYDTEILTLKNTSSDDDGLGDIAKSVWDILTFGAGAELTCPPGPALCNYTIQPMPTGDHTAKLSVEDSFAETSSTQKPFTLKRDIKVDFECSLDGSTWQKCNIIKPAQDEIVQVKDISTPSEGAAIITGWAWIFQSGSPASATTKTASTKFQASGSKTVTLQVTDNNGRTRTGIQTINLAIPFPEWQEISPF